ncbi:hypothetical protein [Anaeromyxobacter terrae]|uniref:hypothetical protein n=1 Tax=Anaeromyxobacter terrae TaxID=2925406 RepID=UPI001F58AEF1|nr:hypothetical protein [Anaeromyxobacter sp. SG22]
MAEPDATLDAALAPRNRDAGDGCLGACCALATSLLFGVDPGRSGAALPAAFSAIPGGATFANARVVLARLYRVRSEVVSGSLARMLSLSGAAGLVVLGVNPRLVYPGAAPGRHAVLLASSTALGPAAWASRLLDVAPGAAPDARVRFIDPSRSPARQEVPLATLAAAFDGAGREALLVSPERGERHGQPVDR